MIINPTYNWPPESICTSTSTSPKDIQRGIAAGSTSETTEAQLHLGMDLGVSRYNPGNAVVAMYGGKIIVFVAYIYICVVNQMWHTTFPFAQRLTRPVELQSIYINNYIYIYIYRQTMN